MRRLLPAVLLAAMLPATAFSQTFGNVTGEVRDGSGAVVSGVAVVLFNPATSGERSATTNAEGVYSFPAIPPGIYDVRISAPGFQPMTRRGIELQVQQTARIDFTLQVGQVSEVVEVSAASPLLTTEDATVGTVIENRRIVDLPLNGRNALALVFLSPNVTAGFGNSNVGAAGDRGVFSSVSIAGARPVFNHYTLDGLENTYVEGNSYAFLPSIDALQEFKIQSGVYPAEFGREIGQINISTKPGGNEFHGTLFEFLRNSALDARNYDFTPQRPPKDPFRWNQYGFTLGGPVRIPKLFNGRNRLFFMSNFEGFRQRRNLRLFSDVPSQAMRGGNFGQIAQTLYDPTTRVREGATITAQPFPNRVIPQSRIARTSTQLLDFLPLPNQPGAGLSANFQLGRSSAIDRDQFNQRIDFIESSSSNWFGRFSWANELALNPGVLLNGGKTINDPWQAMVSNTRTLSTSLVNDFRFGVSHFSNNGVGELAFVRDASSELNIPGVARLAPDGWGLPAITYTGFSGFGGTPGGTIRYATTFQWVDNLHWVRGKHTLRAGAEIRRERWNASSYTFGQGQFDFFGTATQNPASPASTGFAFAEFLLGYIGNSRAGVTQAFAQFRSTHQAYYVDDSWKLRPNLTVTLGLRYEYTPPFNDRSQKWVNAHIPFLDREPNVADRARHPTLVRIGSGEFYQGVGFRFNPAINVARDGRLGSIGVYPDRNDFAPRLGLAFSPSPRWTVRTGAGAFFSQDTSAPVLDPARNLAGFRSEQASPDFPNLTWEAPFLGLGQSVQVNTPSVLANDPRRRTPYAFQYLLNVQRELMRDLALEVGYLGSVSRKLQQFHNFNAPDPSPTGSVASRAPWPEFGRVFQVSGFGKANYNALAVKLTRRFNDGLTYLVSYTWSKSMDTGSGIRVPPGDTLFVQDGWCQSCDRAISGFNAAHRVVTSALYELPFGKGKPMLNNGGRVLNALAGGWQLSSIITLQTGFPVNVVAGRDQSNTGRQADRVNATGQPTALPRGQQDPQRFFNTGAYALQPFGSFGNAGRNTIIGPGTISWDFSTIKNFRFLETREVEFRFEAFNFPNHPNWGRPNPTQTSVSFGRVTSTATLMRSLQFGLKLNF